MMTSVNTKVRNNYLDDSKAESRGDSEVGLRKLEVVLSGHTGFCGPASFS